PPRCPQVDQHWDRGLFNDLSEIEVTRIDHPWQPVMTVGAARFTVGSRRHPVAFSAIRDHHRGPLADLPPLRRSGALWVTDGEFAAVAFAPDLAAGGDVTAHQRTPDLGLDLVGDIA